MNIQNETINTKRKLKVIDYPGEKGPIIALHGLTGNYLQLRHYVESLNQEYRVITLDFRGRGDSDSAENPSSIFEHANDIRNLIEEMKLDSPILMGYSMGGFVSSIVASIGIPIKALILLDGAATMSEHQIPIVEPTFGRLSKHYFSKEDYVATVTSSYMNMGIGITQELIKNVGYEVENKGDYWGNKSCERTIRQDWKSFWEFDINSIGTKINCPTLLVEATGNIGNNPPLFIPESYVNTKKSIRNLKIEISEASHYTMVFEKREDINKFIHDFLNKLEN
ncbi:alpha/beta hydrolase [Proteiniborus sp. MB09-C3]|uniref:alpha/beta fold hydrolase n=1 Tax=Proteiniborus sp. MB09-C3 TaxID=3050072 RepID=UPI00255623D7|nr:alpha/beta hydrolase [Proteiniborus sp. MB09-C3]WIV12292.1 alpha/beta hydrolase [Proteiniborus sp. MB09-C3]